MSTPKIMWFYLDRAEPELHEKASDAARIAFVAARSGQKPALLTSVARHALKELGRHETPELIKKFEELFKLELEHAKFVAEQAAKWGETPPRDPDSLHEWVCTQGPRI